jgi:glycerophosphoryl diester phosphodiesterase
MTTFFLLFFCALSFGMLPNRVFALDLGQTRPVVIAHRGASAYLPEHTLASASMAYAMGADYIELDLVVSKDSQLIVIHDLTLEETTDVEAVFPQKKREDGKWYVIDFSLAELKTLRVHERTNDDKGTLHLPGRFPFNKSMFHISTFQEMVELVQGLNKSTHKKVGIYSEIKDYSFHLKEGKDPLPLVIKAHSDYGYNEKDSGAVLQSFDSASLKRLRTEFKTKLPLVQLIGGAWAGPEHFELKTPAGLAGIAKYADGIGPSIRELFDFGTMKPTPLAAEAKKHQLVIHPYTLRADQLPKGTSFETVAKGLFAMGANGIFTDNPDLLRKLIP